MVCRACPPRARQLKYPPLDPTDPVCPLFPDQDNEGYGADPFMVEVTLRSADGREWFALESQGPGRAGRGSRKKAESHAVLKLESPTSVSLFPVSKALASTISSLEDDAPVVLHGRDAAEGAGDGQPQAIVEVFEAQPAMSNEAIGNIFTDLRALIVISRNIPRPQVRLVDSVPVPGAATWKCAPIARQVSLIRLYRHPHKESPSSTGSSPIFCRQRMEDLSCVLDGHESRAVWLSWSMVLCRYVTESSGIDGGGDRGWYAETRPSGLLPHVE